MTTKTLDLNDIERKLFWFFAVLIGICLVMYLYSVMSLTVNGVERDRMVRAAREVSNTAGDLEQEYLGLQNHVTLSYAENLGFREISAKYTGSSADNASPQFSFAR